MIRSRPANIRSPIAFTIWPKHIALLNSIDFNITSNSNRYYNITVVLWSHWHLTGIFISHVYRFLVVVSHPYVKDFRWHLAFMCTGFYLSFSCHVYRLLYCHFAAMCQLSFMYRLLCVIYWVHMGCYVSFISHVYRLLRVIHQPFLQVFIFILSATCTGFCRSFIGHVCGLLFSFISNVYGLLCDIHQPFLQAFMHHISVWV